MKEFNSPWDRRFNFMQKDWVPIANIPHLGQTWEVVPAQDPRYSREVNQQPVDVSAEHVQDTSNDSSTMILYVILALYVATPRSDSVAEYVVYEPNETIVGIYTDKEQAIRTKELLEKYKDDNIKFFLQEQHLQ